MSVGLQILRSVGSGCIPPCLESSFRLLVVVELLPSLFPFIFVIWAPLLDLHYSWNFICCRCFVNTSCHCYFQPPILLPPSACLLFSRPFFCLLQPACCSAAIVIVAFFFGSPIVSS